jgi:hypothetical protein
MARLDLFPHRRGANVAGAIYGLVLGSSVIAAAGADHPRQAGLVEIYLCVTALVFYLAHVYARVIGVWIEGAAAPTWPAVREELRRERPMVVAQLLPALLLLLGAIGAIPGGAAISLAVGVALAELMAGVSFACWRAGANPNQLVLSLGTAGFFAIVVVALKVFVHG